MQAFIYVRNYITVDQCYYVIYIGICEGIIDNKITIIFLVLNELMYIVYVRHYI